MRRMPRIKHANTKRFMANYDLHWCANVGCARVLDRSFAAKDLSMPCIIGTAIVETHVEDTILILKNIKNTPVHLNKVYVVGSASAYNGPAHAIPKEAATTLVHTQTDVPRKTAGYETNGEPPPPHQPDGDAPRAEVHLDGVPGVLRDAVDSLLEES